MAAGGGGWAKLPDSDDPITRDVGVDPRRLRDSDHSDGLTFRQILAVIALSANSVKGKAALQIAREVGVQCKIAWAMLMKLHEALVARREKLRLTGEIAVLPHG
jgi:hypothetical protein